MFKVHIILNIGTALNEQIDLKCDRLWNTVAQAWTLHVDLALNKTRMKAMNDKW